MLCLSDRHIELMLNFELTEFHLKKPHKLDEQMVVISSKSLPKGTSCRDGISRDPFDELKFTLVTHGANSADILELDLSCLKKLREDFENDVDIDMNNIEGIKAVQLKGTHSKLTQSIGCFDHFIVKWEPQTWNFEVSSSKLNFP